MVFEFMDKAWVAWTGGDIIQIGATIVGLIVVYALVRAVILAGTKEPLKPP
jgi:hypothetical protein